MLLNPFSFSFNAPGKIKGWAFGDDKTIACANVDGTFYAVDGRCPRCAFDLYKGKLLTDRDVSVFVHPFDVDSNVAILSLIFVFNPDDTSRSGAKVGLQKHLA